MEARQAASGGPPKPWFSARHYLENVEGSALPHLSQIDAPTTWSEGQAPQASPDLGRCYRIASW